MDRTYKRLVLSDRNADIQIDSWDLSELVDIQGFSNVIGWFRFLNSECEGDDLETNSVCAKTVAVVTGTWENCYEKTRCEEVTGVFELEDGGGVRLIKLIRAPSRAAVRLSDGRIVVSVGHHLVLFDPPTALKGNT